MPGFQGGWMFSLSVKARGISPLLPGSPVVAGPPDLKLQGAQRVGDVLNRVTQAVREVVGRVDAPLVTGVGVRHVLDPAGVGGAGEGG